MTETKPNETAGMSEEHPHHISRDKVVLIVLLLATVFVAIWLGGYVPRRNQENAAMAAANDVKTAVPSVTTALVRRSAADVDIVLPGSISALSEAAIYSRATGYVRKRYVDIGDHVRS